MTLNESKHLVIRLRKEHEARQRIIAEQERELLLFANSQPILLSLLYDLDLLPEQHEPKSADRIRMLLIASHWKRAFDAANVAKVNR